MSVKTNVTVPDGSDADIHTETYVAWPVDDPPFTSFRVVRRLDDPGQLPIVIRRPVETSAP